MSLSKIKMTSNSFLRAFARVLLCCSLLLCSYQNSIAQEKENKKEIDPEELLARKAALKSAILPGWGQIQNGGNNLFKLPLIYGGLGALGYLTYDRHIEYKCYAKAYLLSSQGLFFDPCGQANTAARIQSGLELTHKQRDMFALFTVGAYLLQVLDAYVWAHLKQFDNSDDLSLQVYPSFTNIANHQTAQLSLKLRF